MKKILVIGISGAGKSMFSRALSERVHIPLICLDVLFWKPGWIKEDPVIFEENVSKYLKTDAWIIDGNFSDSLDLRIQPADTIFFFDFPRLLCLWNIVKRRIIFHNKKRPDIADGCKENLNRSFLKYVWYFSPDSSYLKNKKPAPLVMAWLQEVRGSFS